MEFRCRRTVARKTDQYVHVDRGAREMHSALGPAARSFLRIRQTSSSISDRRGERRGLLDLARRARPPSLPPPLPEDLIRRAANREGRLPACLRLRDDREGRFPGLLSLRSTREDPFPGFPAGRARRESRLPDLTCFGDHRESPFPGSLAPGADRESLRPPRNHTSSRPRGADREDLFPASPRSGANRESRLPDRLRPGLHEEGGGSNRCDSDSMVSIAESVTG